MKFSKSFLITVISLTIVLLALVAYKASSHNQFRNDALKWARYSFDEANYLNLSEIETMGGNKLFLKLDSAEYLKIGSTTVVTVNPEEVLNEPTFNKIKKHDGPIILLLSDQSRAARVWMVLSQMGIKNLYILNED